MCVLKPNTLTRLEIHESFVHMDEGRSIDDIATWTNEFRLSDEDKSKEIVPESLRTVEMRFWIRNLLDTIDDFSNGIEIKINGDPLPLPIAPPLPHLTLSFTRSVTVYGIGPNEISVSYRPAFNSVWVNVALIHHRTPEEQMKKLEAEHVRPMKYTKNLIAELMAGTDDNATTDVSLICPLSKARMKRPCRAITCRHLQCFDARSYLEANVQNAEWKCPVCGHHAFFEHLIIDNYFQLLLRKLPKNHVNFKIFKDGSWLLADIEERSAKRDKVPLASVESERKESNASDGTEKMEFAPVEGDKKGDNSSAHTNVEDCDAPDVKRRCL